MSILEVILILVIVVLVVVLILETREYKKTRQFSDGLERAIYSYTSGFNALAATVQALEKSYERAFEEHRGMGDELMRQGALLEIHNRALNLNSNLLKTIEPFNNDNSA